MFDLIRSQAFGDGHTLAVDLLELDGEDLCRQLIQARKPRLAALLRGAHSTIVANEHYEGDGAIIHKHTCKLRGHRVEAARLTVQVGPISPLS